MHDDDLTIPEALRRVDTPESKAARERIIKQMSRRQPRRVEKSRSTLSTGYAANLDEAGKEILRETIKETTSETQKKRARRALRNARGSDVGTPGPKEQALREARKPSKPRGFADLRKAEEAAKANGKPPVSDVTNISMAELNMAPGVFDIPKPDPVPASSAAEAAQPKESKVRTKTDKGKSNVSARTKVKDVHVVLTKKDAVVSLLRKGATMDALTKSTGWSPHSIHGLIGGLRAKDKMKIVMSKGKTGNVYRIA